MKRPWTCASASALARRAAVALLAAGVLSSCVGVPTANRLQHGDFVLNLANAAPADAAPVASAAHVASN
jgi:hypothetical protein